jgi:hypothetical protein
VHLFSSLVVLFRLFPPPPPFFLASSLVLCSFVFMYCTYPSVSGHGPLMQHCDLAHFLYIDTHFMTSHRFMSEGFGISRMSLKLQQAQYEHISCVSKIERRRTFTAY